MSYVVHRFDVDMETDAPELEVFLNGLDGEIVSIIPNVRNRLSLRSSGRRGKSTSCSLSSGRRDADVDPVLV